MLRSLNIRDFVIVDQAEIHFESGFTVFSGETGAGKSILIDALSLALGARGDTASIRQDASRTDVSAVFDVPAELHQALLDQDLDPTESLVLRRVIDNQGRSRAYINGIPATLTQLRTLGESLIDIHGQHAHQSLIRPASQRDMLDAQGGHHALARATQQAWQNWQHAQKTLQKARDNHEALQQERERLQWQLDELQRLSPGKNEWETLTANHNRLAHAQALLDGANQALAALEGDESSAQLHLSAALHQLQPLLRHDSHLQGICDALESARIAATEAVSDLNSYLDRLELDPQSLAQAEQRMSALFEAARQFKTEPELLPQLQEALQGQLAETDVANNLDALTEQARQAEATYHQAARQLSAARKKAAKKLSAQVTDAMQTLAMQGGRFDIALEPAAPSAHGCENIEFLVAGHAGVTPRPLAKVASGGELARLSLALSVIASQAARVPTLIFDEVDTGVGGAVAEVVGRLLRELGTRHQVLCVTHLPQVAACGDHHYEVSKATRQGATLSNIQLLSADARIDEVARMLGGLKITNTTRQHAREMLSS